MNRASERRLLQIAIAIAACVPVAAGAAGAVLGAGMISGAEEASPSLDSHLRYLSGLLLAEGLLFWVLIPTIERQMTAVHVMTLLVVVGGLARLGGLLVAEPGLPMKLALVMELLVTPALCLWQARVAARYRQPAGGAPGAA